LKAAGSIFIFVQLGLNETDTIQSSSILIYYYTEQDIYMWNGWLDAAVD